MRILPKKLVFSLLITILISPLLPLSDADAEDVTREKIQQHLQNKEIVLNELAKQDKELQRFVEEINQTNTKIKKIQQQAAPIEQRLTNAEKEMEKYDQILKKRIRMFYEQGQFNYTSQLLESQSFGQFLNKLETIRIIIKQDTALIEERRKVVEKIKKEKSKFDVLVSEQNEQIKKSKVAYDALVKEFQKSQKDLNDLEAFEELHEDEFSQINLEDWKNGKLRFPYNGKMQRPSHGPTTSQWGYRNHPIYKRPILHQGADYGGGTGTPIYSAGDGVVVSSAPASGYGWLITIYHGEKNGKHVFTRYAHSYPNQVKVHAGERVKAGERISSVGANGNVTGPHLHFEVRYGNGEKPPSSDPRKWIS
ncbi:peptidoglycan DD-metalloendopeptidase family protein [Shimazuella sp. AN120528]|uniref:murein hydrolase activator EnvC family protein n=1 Tax=Shimazuella soli TaxID=1892854 RepID=UPI001F116684|nr:M23 family metallopeptidase [Shimazuella soli]MCH5586635.1 peptidoglycan DD-metalloendopeptidase family protein [Shimazuella soli]